MTSNVRSERHTVKPGEPEEIVHVITTARPMWWQDFQTRANGSVDFEGNHARALERILWSIIILN